MSIEAEQKYDDESNSTGWIGGKAKIDEADRRRGVANHVIATERHREDHDGAGEDDITTDRNLVRVLRKKYNCRDCGWFNPNFLTCRAFPDAIPVVILSDDFEHVIPYKGDGGYRWTPKTGATQ